MVDDSSNANAWVSAWTNSGVGLIALAYASRACDTGLTLGRIVGTSVVDYLSVELVTRSAEV
jgi:hypothetical protein